MDKTAQNPVARIDLQPTAGEHVRAFVLDEPQSLRYVEDWPEPVCGPDDVIVQVRGVGLCGTDLATYDGKSIPPRSPWIIGHEGGGDIVAVGSRVTNRSVGQRVIIEPNIGDGTCDICLAGHTSACEHRLSIGSSLTGLLAERVAAPAAYTWAVDDSVSYAQIACFEPLAVALAAVRRASIPVGADVLVIGAGSVGQLVAQALIAEGANAFITDPHEGRLKRALTLGARKTSDRENSTYPFVFETSGAGAVWQMALDSLQKRGLLTLIGFMRDEVTLAPVNLTREQQTVRGHLIYDHPQDFQAALDAVYAGKLVPDASIEAVYSVDDTVEAFAAVRNVAGKTWIDFESWQG